jgi:hypothetical protein
VRWDVVFYYQGKRYASKVGGVESPTQVGALSSTVASHFPARQIGLIYDLVRNHGGRWHANPVERKPEAAKAKETASSKSPDMLPDADGSDDPPWPARRRSKPSA